MTRRMVLVFCFAAALMAPAARAADAPAFALASAQGAAVSLDSLRGKVVLVDFWASWCIPCLKSFPWLDEMQAKYGAKGLQVVGVNLDKTAAEAERFLKRVPHAFTILYDPSGDSAKTYGVKAMPSSYLIDRRGALILDHGGFRDADKETLEAAILAALESK